MEAYQFSHISLVRDQNIRLFLPATRNLYNLLEHQRSKSLRVDCSVHICFTKIASMDKNKLIPSFDQKIYTTRMMSYLCLL
jgi:hypothetical protein